MRITISIDITNCDDCPFLAYTDLSDNCTLSDEEIPYPFAFENISEKCPLNNLDKIKYSVVKVE